MGRVAFSWNAFQKQSYDDGVIPVNGGGGTQGGGSLIVPKAATRRRDGPATSLGDDYVAQAQSGGSGRATFYTTRPRWQIYANALVELPWGVRAVGGRVRPRGPGAAALLHPRGRPAATAR